MIALLAHSLFRLLFSSRTDLNSTLLQFTQVLEDVQLERRNAMASFLGLPSVDLDDSEPIKEQPRNFGSSPHISFLDGVGVSAE
jgi:hypothetical protein